MRVSQEISPDSAYGVVFIGGNGTPDLQDLYSVPLTGGPAVRLDTFLNDTDGIAEYAVSDNSARVVFRASDSSFRSSLYSVPIGGGSHASFAPAQPSGQGIAAPFFITPDSARIVFREGRQYRSAPMSGGGEVIVADDINSSAGAAYATNHRITNDSQYLTLPPAAAPVTGPLASAAPLRAPRVGAPASAEQYRWADHGPILSRLSGAKA